MKTVKLTTFADNLKDDLVFEVPYQWLSEKLGNVSVEGYLNGCDYYDNEKINHLAAQDDVIISIAIVEGNE
jgi:hypothetical protein